MVATNHRHQSVCDLFNESLDLTSLARKSGGIPKSLVDKCKGRKSPPKNKKKQKGKKSRKLSIDQLVPSSSSFDLSSWEPVGTSYRKWVHFNNDARPVRRDCFDAIRHKHVGVTIRVRDCVVIKSSDNYNFQQQQNVKQDNLLATTKRSYVGKIAEFFMSPNGALWASLVWYYWPEEAEVTSIDDLDVFENVHPKELLASKHIDCVSVDSIECLTYVITFNEYNRYMAENKSESLWNFSFVDEFVPRAYGAYVRRGLMPTDDTDDAMVYFCRRVYDFHGKRLIRNPSF